MLSKFILSKCLFRTDKSFVLFHAKVFKSDILPSCQVDQIDNSALGHFLPCFILAFLYEVDPDDGVSSGRSGVHVGRRHRPVLVAFHHQLVDLTEGGDGKLRETSSGH